MRSSRLIWRGSSRFFFRATGKRSRPVREAADFQFAGSGLADDFTTPGSEGDSFDRRAAGGAATASDAAAGSQANPRRNRERSYRSLQRCAAGDAAGGGGKGRRSPDGPSDAAPSPGPARLGSPRFHPGWLFAGDAAHTRVGGGVSAPPQIALARVARISGSGTDHGFGDAALLGRDVWLAGGERASPDRADPGAASVSFGADGRHQLRCVFGSLRSNPEGSRRAVAAAARPSGSRGARLAAAIPASPGGCAGFPVNMNAKNIPSCPPMHACEAA